MDIPRNLSGCNIIIYDRETKEMLLKATILKNVSVDETIEIRNGFPTSDYPSVLDLIIFAPDGVIKAIGIVNSPKFFPIIEIALVNKDANSNSRQSMRFNINMKSTIEYKVLEDGTFKKYMSPPVISILDISTTGVLFRSGNDSFKIGAKFLIKLGLTEEDKVILCTVMRKKEISETQSEYGGALDEVENPPFW